MNYLPVPVCYRKMILWQKKKKIINSSFLFSPSVSNHWNSAVGFAHLLT